VPLTREPAANLRANLEWSELRLRERFGGGTSITAVEPIASRLAEVYRLEVSTGSDKRHCYLKDCGLVDLEMPPSDYEACLSVVARAFEAKADVLPSPVLAFDAGRRLLLTTEVPGRPLSRLHRTIMLSSGRRKVAIAAWRGVGRWLATLHWTTGLTAVSDTRSAELVAFTTDRFRRWSLADPRCSGLAEQAIEATGLAAAQLRARSITTTLCHGDVSAGNIMLHGSSVGLIDLDDLRFDLPGVDVSLGLLEIAEFSHVASVVFLRHFAADAETAFRDGYGRAFPEGPEFWLPHMRNLAVFLLTLAKRRTGPAATRLMDELRYRRTQRELARTVSTITGSP
jgi:Ser/Thr protein kinase RdoA (MazF antagonist)